MAGRNILLAALVIIVIGIAGIGIFHVFDSPPVLPRASASSNGTNYYSWNCTQLQQTALTLANQAPTYGGPGVDYGAQADDFAAATFLLQVAQADGCPAP